MYTFSSYVTFTITPYISIQHQLQYLYFHVLQVECCCDGLANSNLIFPRKHPHILPTTRTSVHRWIYIPKCVIWCTAEAFRWTNSYNNVYFRFLYGEQFRESKELKPMIKVHKIARLPLCCHRHFWEFTQPLFITSSVLLLPQHNRNMTRCLEEVPSRLEWFL